MKFQESNWTFFDIRKERTGGQEWSPNAMETGTVSTECFLMLYSEIPVELAIYTKDNDLLEE